LKPFTKDGVEHQCRFKKVFPPPQAEFPDEFGGTIEEQRMGGLLEPGTYQKILTWQRVCGLVEMKEEKCLACANCFSFDCVDEFNRKVFRSVLNPRDFYLE
jgi:hypothetical protein